jgi:hypothetical protein
VNRLGGGAGEAQLRSSPPHPEPGRRSYRGRCLLLGLLMCVCQGACSTTSTLLALEKGQEMRCEVKRYLDELVGCSLESLAQTTDSMAGPKRRWQPKAPAPFPAGSYKAVFRGHGRAYALLAQTEEKFPHFSTIRPGLDKIGGFVQLFVDPRGETPEGQVLLASELDYLIRIVYSKACAPLDEAAAGPLDALKDRLLAIRFNSKPSMVAHHQRLLDLIENGSLCRP